ncbi:MAG: DUF4190 domain-containing protein [Lachnospiraceae bacterium]|nr:DUF4190 domain-containing protein [Lachnospiraceae bacterium]
MDNNNMMNNDFDQQPVYQQPQPVENKSNTKSILALVFGILALLISCCCTYLGIILGIVGIVMAVLSKNDNDGKFSGMAIAGLICSILGIVISVVSIILVLTGTVSNGFTEYLNSMQY